jgi:hypothetical protein
MDASLTPYNGTRTVPAISLSKRKEEVLKYFLVGGGAPHTYDLYNAGTVPGGLADA